MQNLYDFLTEHMLKESFASDTMRTLFFSLKPKMRKDNSYYLSGQFPMWDKIKDSDLTKLDKDEALKRMRSRKEPGYLIWFRNNGMSCNGITWGCDVVMTWDGFYKNVSASSIAYDADGAYEISSTFIRSDIQKSRREAKEGATALMDYDKIKNENLARYEKKLAKLRNPGLEAVIKVYTDAMEIYKNVTDKYVAKFVSMMQEGNGSYYSMSKAWETLNKIVKNMTDDAHLYQHTNGYHDDKDAMYYYKKVSEAAKQIEEIANTFEANSK